MIKGVAHVPKLREVTKVGEQVALPGVCSKVESAGSERVQEYEAG